ncbi:MAG: ferredoxin [Desulfobacterales bacterium]|nr:ferredoxin [Desulfobacterales bacterium]
MKRPVVELSDCIRCEVCVEVCPAVFRMNDAGFIEVADLTAYPGGRGQRGHQELPGGLHPLGRRLNCRQPG